MNLCLKLPSGRDYNYKCEPNTTIKELREKASSEINIDPTQLQLILEGKILDEKGTVESSNIPEGTKITVMTIVNA